MILRRGTRLTVSSLNGRSTSGSARIAFWLTIVVLLVLSLTGCLVTPSPSAAPIESVGPTRPGTATPVVITPAPASPSRHGPEPSPSAPVESVSPSPITDATVRYVTVSERLRGDTTVLIGVDIIAGSTADGPTLELPLDVPDATMTERGHSVPFVVGPRASEALVGFDDGTASHLLRITVDDGIHEEVFTSPQPIMHAAFDADQDIVYLALIDRTTLREAGIWSVDLRHDDPIPQLIRPPQRDPLGRNPAPVLERLWLSDDGSTLLAIRRAGDQDRYEVFRGRDGMQPIANAVHRSSDFGGMTDQVAVGARVCPACGYVVVALETGNARELGEATGDVRVVSTADGSLVIVTSTSDDDSSTLVAIDPLTGHTQTIWHGPSGFALVPLLDTQGYQLPPGIVLLAANGSFDPAVPGGLLVDVTSGEEAPVD